MADNLRSITELEVLTEVPDGTYTVVVDGGTAKLAPYGGGGAEAIEIVYTSADGETVTCDKTYEEIYEALVTNNGVAIAKFRMEVDTGTAEYRSSFWNLMDYTSVGGPAAFVFVWDFGGSLLRVIHESSNTITAVEDESEA